MEEGEKNIEINISQEDIEIMKQKIFFLSEENERLKKIINGLNNQITNLSNNYL